MKKQILLLSLQLLALLGCDSPSSQFKDASPTAGIVGGSLATKSDDFRIHLVMVYDEKRHFLCSGTLIRRDLVLTAAHCVAQSSPEDVQIIFGLNIEPSEDRITIPANALVVHGGYNTKSDLSHETSNDIALVRMSERAPSDYESASLVSNVGNLESQSNRYLAAGYGRTLAEQKDSGQLRKVNVQASNLAVVKDGMLIALNASTDGGPCEGDSGGPLFMIKKSAAGNNTYAVLGITSFVSQTIWNGVKIDQFCKGIAYYTSVAKYYDWIEKNAARL